MKPTDKKYTPRPGTQAEKLVNAIVKSATAIRSDALAEATGVPVTSHNSMLEAAIAAGMVSFCKVTTGNGREMREYRRGPGIPLAGKGSQLKTAKPTIIPVRDPIGAAKHAPTASATNLPTLAEHFLGKAETSSQPQPAVGKNTGSPKADPHALTANDRAVTTKAPEAESKQPLAGDVIALSITDEGALKMKLGTADEFDETIQLSHHQVQRLGEFLTATQSIWKSNAHSNGSDGAR